MIIIISFLLDGIISNYIDFNSYFIPLFSLMSLVLINKKEENYYGYAILLGILYDISYTDTLFLNCFVFLLISSLIMKLFRLFNTNILSSILIGILSIISYRILTYFILSIIGYLNFSLKNLFISIITSIPINIIYICLIYLIRYAYKYIKKRVIN